MKELGGVVEYLYWSGRRTDRFLNDNNIPIPQLSSTIATPSLSWLPSFTRTAVDLGNRRPVIAKTIEAALGQIAVARFDGPSPIKYAKGTSPLVFGEFKTFNIEHEREPAVMFTAVDQSRRYPQSVAVCLFGSMDNFLEYARSAGPGYDGGPLGEGWVSSAAPAVYNFIRTHGKQLDDPYYTPERMAIEALKIADGQGIFKAGNEAGVGLDRAWERSFTYGEVVQAQWLAEIYLDVDTHETAETDADGYRRILIGAPLWVRTPSLQAISLYAQADMTTLAARSKRRPKRKGNPSALDQHVSAESNLVERPDQQFRVPTVAVPHGIVRTLTAGFVADTAALLVRHMNDDPPRITLLGTPFGRVFAWAWSHDRDEAMIILSDLLANVRNEQEETGKGDADRVRLDEILRALPLCLPAKFADYREVVRMARKEVREYLGSDPNA